MIDHEGKIKEKEDRRSCIVDSIVVPENMECAAFAGEAQTTVITSNM